VAGSKFGLLCYVANRTDSSAIYKMTGGVVDYRNLSEINNDSYTIE
jgi:hypothetical protein